MKIKCIALDLEGTLISNAVSQFTRPGLYAFLEECHQQAEKVVMITAVREPLFRQIAALLVKEGDAPEWFATMEYINWDGDYKDLNFIDGYDINEIVIVDDNEDYIHPDQKSQWIRIEKFHPPYSQDDKELEFTLKTIKAN